MNNCRFGDCQVGGDTPAVSNAGAKGVFPILIWLSLNARRQRSMTELFLAVNASQAESPANIVGAAVEVIGLVHRLLDAR